MLAFMKWVIFYFRLEGELSFSWGVAESFFQSKARDLPLKQ